MFAWKSAVNHKAWQMSLRGIVCLLCCLCSLSFMATEIPCPSNVFRCPWARHLTPKPPPPYTVLMSDQLSSHQLGVAKRTTEFTLPDQIGPIIKLHTTHTTSVTLNPLMMLRLRRKFRQTTQRSAKRNFKYYYYSKITKTNILLQTVGYVQYNSKQQKVCPAWTSLLSTLKWGRSVMPNMFFILCSINIYIFWELSDWAVSFALNCQHFFE